MAEGNRRENMKRRDSNSGETKGTSRRRPSSSASERVSTRIPIDVKPQATVETQRKRPSASAAERIADRIPVDVKPQAAVTERKRPSASAAERIADRIPVDPEPVVATERKRPSATAAERIVEHIPAHRPVASNPAPVEPRPASTAKKSGCCMLTMLGMLGAGAGIISLLAAIF